MRGLDSNYRFIRYAGSTLVNHLKICYRQTPEICAHVKHEASPKKSNVSSSASQNIQLPWLPLPDSSGFQHSSLYPQMLPPSMPPTRTHLPLGSTTSLSALPSPYTHFVVLMDQSPLLSPGQFVTNHPTPKSQSQSILINDSGVWPPEFQRKFEERIVRLTASAGLPLYWVDNPEWIDLVNNFLPSARSPSRKVLTNCLTPAITKEYRDMKKVAARDQNTTLQADGWTGANFHHLLTFMIAFNKQVRSESSP